MKKHYVIFQNNNGQRNHYYHFFYGVYLPLCRFIAEKINSAPFALITPDCREMNRHLISHPILPAACQLELVPQVVMPKDALWIEGIDDAPDAMRQFFSRTEESVRKRLLGQLGVSDPIGNKTVVVDRIKAPDGQYAKESYGADRRTIVNLSEITQSLRANGHDVERVALERMTLSEQAQCFASASTIIAQHGAGLSNIYFCRPECRVIEIGANGRRHFKNLSRILGLHYTHVETDRNSGPCIAAAAAVVRAASPCLAIA